MLDKGAADPAHRDGTNVIADFLRVARFDMDRPAQRRMFSKLSALATWDGLPRSCAFLAGGEPIWTLAGTIVAQTTLKSPIVFDRFQSPAEAIAFIGLDARLHAGRFGYATEP